MINDPHVLSHSNLSSLLSARNRLSSAMAQAARLHSAVRTSDHRISQIAHDLPLLQLVIDSFHTISSDFDAVSSKVDVALQNASVLLQTFQAIHALEKSVDHDPKSDLHRYLNVVCRLERYLHILRQSHAPVLDRLQEAVMILKQTRSVDNYRLRVLTDTLAELRRSHPLSDLEANDGFLSEVLHKLEIEFERLIADNSSPMDLAAYASGSDIVPTVASPPEFLSAGVVVNLLAICDRLKANGRAHRCLQIYVDARSKLGRKSIPSLSPSYLQYSTPDAVGRLSWDEVLQYIPLWVQHLKVIVTVLFAEERKLCAQIFKTFHPSLVEKCFGITAEQSSLTLYFRFGEAVGLSNHTPERRLCGLLEVFMGFQEILRDAVDIFEGEGCAETLLRFREHHNQLVHNTCRAFWEFCRNVETYKSSLMTNNGGLDALPSFVVNYLRTLIDFYGSPLEKVLQIQQSWKEAGKQQVVSLSLVVVRIMSALAKNLEDRARSFEDTALAQVFLMNNFRYSLIRSKEYQLDQYLGKGWIKEWQRKADQNVEKYKKEGWEQVLALLKVDGLQLSSNGRKNSTRDQVKERLRSFNLAFEQTYSKHSQWIIVDPQIRESLRLSIIQLLVPAYNSFMHSHGSLLDGAGSRKFLKYSAEAIQKMLSSLFREGPR